MNWSTIWMWVNFGLSIATAISVFIFIKVTNKGYKLKDDHIEFLLCVIKAQRIDINKLEQQIKGFNGYAFNDGLSNKNTTLKTGEKVESV